LQTTLNKEKPKSKSPESTTSQNDEYFKTSDHDKKISKSETVPINKSDAEKLNSP
jgi:hypothetical protein